MTLRRVQLLDSVLGNELRHNVVVTSARGASSVHTIEKTLMNVSNIKLEDDF